jgi:hypothetical protein
MPIQKLEKINPGSIVCGIEDPTLIYKMIEKITYILKLWARFQIIRLLPLFLKNGTKVNLAHDQSYD